MLRLSISAAVFLLIGAVCPFARAQTKPKFIPDHDLVMSPSDAAKTLGVQRLFEWIVSSRSSSGEPLKLVMARQKLIQEVTTASLQVDATAGQIDAEIADVKELQSYLETKRQHEIDLLNIASLVAGGSLGTASASLGLAGEGKASSVSGILAGSVTAGLSAFGLRRRNGSAQALQVCPVARKRAE